eukprot:CAMPEP_0197715542 /NCGR_PEP_ID=MMETSP1434-20131217/684_1 /TAXON_ID=265543 /ORGANISM="Minutocellus polymorphus, Strain CCMP3303" /LENGTH=207 /DNA_ID=CAMNT_0043299675 /DNA_START=40 /DNA_END=663 /DNA_ORIENTATION=+
MPDNTDFACIICHEIVRDCRSTSCCSALLCGQCVEGRELDICPSCRRTDVQFPRNVALQRLANDLDVECNLCRQSYKHADAHGNWCPSQKMRCHFSFLGCSWTDKRKFHEAHLQESHLPKCPNESCGGALLSLGRPKQTDAFCDGCQQSVMKNLNAMICSNCDYLECPGCFINRPIKSCAPGCSIGRRVDVMDAEEEVDEDMNGVKV